MRRLIFFNLSIDQLWDTTSTLRQIFPHRIPESELIIRAVEDLSLFAVQRDDIALISSEETRKLIASINPSATSSPASYRIVRSNPFDAEQWVDEVSSLLDQELKCDDFELWPASLSALELSLLRRFPRLKLPQWLPLGLDFAALNAKSSIQQWAKVAGVPAPYSVIVSTSMLLNDSLLPSLSFPVVIKADHASGGGGNFLLRSKADFQLRVLRRQLEGSTDAHFQWTIQQWFDGAKNISVFGWANGTQPEVFTVDYDATGLSFQHRRCLDSDHLGKARQCFECVSTELKSLGYFGPFGLDLIFDQQQGALLIDVNIRLTKTHLISMAAERLGLSGQNWISLRLRRKNGGVDQLLTSIYGQPDIVPFHRAGDRELSVFVTNNQVIWTQVLQKS